MLDRRLEPEVMDTPEEARDYDAMDHAEVNRAFVAEFLQFLRTNPVESGDRRDDSLSRLDVGTGTALIPIELCRQSDERSEPPRVLRITAIDLAVEMLALAARRVEDAGFSDRIRIERCDAKQMPFADATFDAVISNSIVHHIPQPAHVFHEMKRLLRPGGVLFVRDLLRPCDQATLDALVETYSGGESPHARRMFRDSLHAALALEEVRELLHSLRLPTEWAKRSTDRHWTISGRTTGRTA